MKRLVFDLHQHRAHSAVMQTALIGVEHHGGNDQAKQERAADRSRDTGGVTAHFLHLQAEDAVPDAVARHAYKHDLLGREDGQNGEVISAEQPVGNQRRHRPVDQQGTQARSNTRYGTGTGPGPAKTLARPRAVIGGRAFQPGT